MPPVATKGKAKGRDARRSRSRNTTPSSVISAGTAPLVQSLTPYLNIDTSKLHAPSHPQYGDILDRLDTKSGVPEPKHLETLVEQLRQLSEAAEARAQVCDAAMRQLADKRKAIADEEREQERIDRELELRKAKAKRDTEERSDGAGSRRGAKHKKRKERSEEKLAHVSDGVEVKVEGKPSPGVGVMRLSVRFNWSIRLSSRRRHHFSVVASHTLPQLGIVIQA
jgi:transcriptional adapter 3